MDVYQGRFQDNGACGYVLKPAFLRDPNSTFNSRALTQGPWWTRKRLTVRVWPATLRTGAQGPPSSPLLLLSPPLSLASAQVISGQQLPKVNKNKNSIVDPKVTVEIHGVGRDMASRQTAVVTNNGTHRAWVGPDPQSWRPPS